MVLSASSSGQSVTLSHASLSKSASLQDVERLSNQRMFIDASTLRSCPQPVESTFGKAEHGES